MSRGEFERLQKLAELGDEKAESELSRARCRVGEVDKRISLYGLLLEMRRPIALNPSSQLELARLAIDLRRATGGFWYEGVTCLHLWSRCAVRSWRSAGMADPSPAELLNMGVCKICVRKLRSLELKQQRVRRAQQLVTGTTEIKIYKPQV